MGKEVRTTSDNSFDDLLHFEIVEEQIISKKKQPNGITKQPTKDPEGNLVACPNSKRYSRIKSRRFNYW